MDVIERDDTTAAWHAWRRAGIGASDVAAILGLSKYGSPWTVWQRKTSAEHRPEEDSDAKEFGRRAERFLAEWFTDRTGLHVVGEQTWCSHIEHTWARCTVDGFVAESPASAIADALGVWEAKTTSDPPWPEGAVPGYFEAQAQWSMFVTDTEREWFAVLHMAGGHPRFLLYELARDQRHIDALLEIVGGFWRDNVLAGIAPPVDGSPMTHAALAEQWHPAERTVIELNPELAETLAELAKLRQLAGDLDDEISIREATVKAALGEATDGWIDGELAVSWRPRSSRRIDAAALRARLPRTAARFTTEHETRVLLRHGRYTT